MKIILTLDLQTKYPTSVFGSLKIRSVPNMKMHKTIEQRKRNLEQIIRENTKEVKSLDMIQYYNSYFRRWKKTYTYPIEYQLNTIKNGRNLPQVSVLVDSMFIAELNSLILTSGHDLDTIQGDLTFDISRGDEQYLKINGKEQDLKKGDILLKDEEGIISCILFGPAKRTSITPNTENVLYCAWCPETISDELVKAHLNEILMNVNAVFTNTNSAIQLIHS